MPAAEAATIAKDADIATKNLAKTTITEGGDFAAVKQASLNTKGPVTEVIDWMDAEGNMRTTRYGYDPRSAKPFWFEIPGTELKGEYKSLPIARLGISSLMD